MISLDTNVLVRLLVDDDGEADQCNQARKAVSWHARVFIGQVVQVETVWVLKRAYGFSKPEILAALDHLLSNQAFELEYSELFKNAIAIYRDSSIDFSDALILQVSRQHQYELLTFDSKLARLPGTMTLSRSLS
jgi:predicted nucleic-acid-binding protein